MKYLLLSVLLAFTAQVPAAAQNETLYAHAQVSPSAGHAVHGLVRFAQRGSLLRVHAVLSGLTPGLHAFHIHQDGDCSAGGHFDPAAGDTGDAVRGEQHGGEFGSLTADTRGVALLDMLLPTSQISLQPGQGNSVLLRSVVVHGPPLEMTGVPGREGAARQACGVIRPAAAWIGGNAD